MTHDPLDDPMLDGIDQWHATAGTYSLDGTYIPDGTYVRLSDLPDLIARVRADERRTLTGGERHREWWVAFGMGKVQGQRDEREACIAEITADLTARIQRESEDRDPDLLLGGIDYALQNVLRVIRAREEKP